MTTFYKTLTGLTGLLAVAGILLVCFTDLPVLVDNIIVFISLLAVVAVVAIVGLLKEGDNPRSDKSVRR